jgi:peptidoglycan/LPS O-acetylase OafA/YrhL
MRNAGLDILRGVAILMVIGQHAAWHDGFLGAICTRGGWAGVDLFFVLSGFLVSGLLFKDPAAGRFLARRAWKIYPAFWALMLVTAFVEDVPPRILVNELLFIQNYAGCFWLHTWSLAVEEHFYITLPFALLALRRWSYKPLPWLVLSIVLASTVARLFAGFSPFDPVVGHYTHLRLDSLWVGVFCRWILQNPTAATWCSTNFRRLILCGAPVTISPFVFNMGNALGITILAAGNGLLVLGMVNSKLRLPALQFVGRHSYSIYLWHIPIQYWLAPSPLVFAIISVLAGAAMSKLIESPLLTIRDRIHRPASGTLVLQPRVVHF